VRVGEVGEVGGHVVKAQCEEVDEAVARKFPVGRVVILLLDSVRVHRRAASLLNGH
jgi:hypothetical protein